MGPLVMFTGLVETTGQIEETRGENPRWLLVKSSLSPEDVEIGESIAIDGCCLTVVEKSERGLAFEAATETLKRTTLGQLRVGNTVNLERSLRVGDRLGGHLVSGHVDAVGNVVAVTQDGGARYIEIQLPDDLAPFVAGRGSVTVAGVSLTITAVTDSSFTVGLIPHTLEVTTLDGLSSGTPVNVEVDMMARYVHRILSTQKSDETTPLTFESLSLRGFA